MVGEKVDEMVYLSVERLVVSSAAWMAVVLVDTTADL